MKLFGMANSEDVNALLVYVFLNTKKKIRYTELENNINEFIAGKNIIDIKYNPVFAANTFQAMIVDRVLIIYED